MQPPLPLYHMNQLCPSTLPEALTVQDWAPPAGTGGGAAQFSGGMTGGAGGGGGAAAPPFPMPLPGWPLPGWPLPGWPLPAVIPSAAGGAAPPGAGTAPLAFAGAIGRFALAPSLGAGAPGAAAPAPFVSGELVPSAGTSLSGLAGSAGWFGS